MTATLKRAYETGVNDALTKFGALPLPKFNIRQLAPSAAVGAGAGLLQYGLSKDPDKSLIKSVGGGAALGAGIGGGVSALGRRRLAKDPTFASRAAKVHNDMSGRSGFVGDAYRWMNPNT